MAKDDKQKLFDKSYGLVQQAQTDYGKIVGTDADRSKTTFDRATDNYNPAFQGYSNYAAGGGLTQDDKDRMQKAVDQYGAAVGGGGGGVSWNNINNPMAGKSSAYGSAYRPDYSEADAGYRNLSGKSGGFDQGKLDQIYGNVDTLSGIGKTGGITDEDKSNVNRQSILDQEKTGGFTDQDKALIRAKSAASSPAYFGALKDNLERQRSQTGNLANAGAVDFKMARQGAQQQGADRIAAEQQLQDSVRAGKQQAGDFLSNQNKDLATLRTSNQLAGAGAAAQQGTGVQNAITGNQLQGLGGLASSQTNLGQWGLGQAGGLDQFTNNAAQMDYQTQVANSQGNMQAGAANSASRAAGAQAAAAANMDYQQWLTTYGNEQKQYGIGGLDDMYKTNLGASQVYDSMQLQGLNNMSDSQSAMLGHATANRGTTAMENMQTIGNVAGAVGGAITGLGGLGAAAGAMGKGTGVVQGTGGQQYYQGNPFQASAANAFGGTPRPSVQPNPFAPR
jgi:hypothetical protein